jgi:hypothetical protein
VPLGLGLRRQAADRLVAVEVGGEGVALGGGGNDVAQCALVCAGGPARQQDRVERPHIAVRSTVSIARPKAEETCSRLAMRRTSAERLVPAPWNSAGLKKAASPLHSGSCTKCASK